MKPIALGISLAALLWGASGAAFCRTTTCDPTNPKLHCQIDPDTRCLLTGVPVFWASSCITVNVQRDGAPHSHISLGDAEASVQRAFDSWLSADCNGAAPSLQVVLGEPVSCDQSEYEQFHHNANIVMFREDVWPYEGGEDALGITRLRFDLGANVGELWDGDIEVNAVMEPLSVSDPESNQVDLDSLITHEVGHLFGLAHSLDADSTMIAGYVKGSIDLRSQSADDLAGICAIYPPGRATETDSCEPRHGFSELCSSEQPAFVEPETTTKGSTSKGCGVSSGRPSAASAWLAVLVGALWQARRRRQLRAS
jgi:MYXO-CTERM domain-containing protein